MNGFFMSMRSKFVTPGVAIYYYVVEWESKSLGWEDFRGSVLGPTDPADAPADSLRGQIYTKWQERGGDDDLSRIWRRSSAARIESIYGFQFSYMA